MKSGAIKCSHFHAGSEAGCTLQWHLRSPSILHHRQSPTFHCCTPPLSPPFSVFLQSNKCHHYCMVGLEIYVLYITSLNNDYTRLMAHKKVFRMKTSACRNGTLKNQPNKMGTTPQHIYTTPTSCAILPTILCVC